MYRLRASTATDNVTKTRKTIGALRLAIILSILLFLLLVSALAESVPPVYAQSGFGATPTPVESNATPNTPK